MHPEMRLLKSGEWRKTEGHKSFCGTLEILGEHTKHTCYLNQYEARAATSPWL